MTEKIAIRPANPSDAQKMTEIAKKAYAPYVPRMQKYPKPMLENYAELVEQGFCSILEIDGQIAGYIVLVPQENSLLLDNIGIDPAYQKMGLGGKLLQYAEDTALKLSFGKIILHTNEAMTENLQWYPRHGYRLDEFREAEGYKRAYFSKDLSAN